tara:strand:- start:53 stop:724 length:672 start_codon:yes stop_codon:yes gene_type:complete
MPIFADIIYLDRNENEFELVNEFIFKFPKNGKEFKGYNLRMNSKNQLEFDSNDSVYKIPRQHLKNGDKIIINDLNGNTQEFAIIGREFRKVKEEDFKNSSISSYNDQSNLKSIECNICYSKKEMEWILVGTAPAEMEDRIIMYSKDNRIFIFSSWGGQLIYSAKYKKLDDKYYVINNLNIALQPAELTDKQYIDKFKFQLKCHLDYLNWIDKWSNENYNQIKN